jgi:group I intron endonuclease
MKSRFVDKSNHPMFGKTHNSFSLRKISKPGALNPMYNKNHNENTKTKISISQSKRPLALYDLNNQLIKTFLNQVELANYLNLHKTTISRYFRTGKMLKGKYYIRDMQ